MSNKDDFESVLVVHPVLSGRSVSSDQFSKDTKDALDEAAGLAEAINLRVVHKEAVRISRVSPATLIGKGLIERLSKVIEEKEICLVYINHSLSPVQQRNLEKALNVKVIDRTGLILEIFGERARTKEGKLQVELAALDFQRSRLVRSWTHLERQRGGFGFTGGPGETQIEIDRRLIGERITKIKKELEHVKKNRRLQRESRSRVPFPIIALVGYTNAGKSTLFNFVTGAEVFAEDLLFATLDPTMRSCVLPSGKKVILSDTVGFISDLPTSLVASFRATLEEVQNASIILYVRDLTHNDSGTERASVASILNDLDIDIDEDERVIEVLNKIDALPEDEKEKFVNRSCSKDNVVTVSAVSGEGIDLLLEKIDSILSKDENLFTMTFDLTKDGEAISWLYNHGRVISREENECECIIKTMLSDKEINRFQKLYNDIDAKTICDKEQHYISS